MSSLYQRRDAGRAFRSLEAVNQDQTLPPLVRDWNGRIDYAYYLAEARRERSRAFHRLLPGVVAALGSVVPGRELFRRISVSAWYR